MCLWWLTWLVFFSFQFWRLHFEMGNTLYSDDYFKNLCYISKCKFSMFELAKEGASEFPKRSTLNFSVYRRSSINLSILTSYVYLSLLPEYYIKSVSFSDCIILYLSILSFVSEVYNSVCLKVTKSVCMSHCQGIESVRATFPHALILMMSNSSFKCFSAFT